MASTVHTFNDSAFFQLRLRHTTNAICREIRVARLYASQAAEVLISLFLPFGDKVLVGNVLIQTVLVQFLADRLALVIQVENVSRTLVVYFEYWPECFGFAFAFMRCRFDFSHFSFKFVECRFDEFPALWRSFTLVSWHSILELDDKSAFVLGNFLFFFLNYKPVSLCIRICFDP
jgi:hypothetical protein